jgi:hypothetical protein
MWGISLAEALSEIVDRCRRKMIAEKANKAYASLKADRKKWETNKEEMAVLDSSLKDGLE